MALDGTDGGRIDRRSLLIGGGAGIGLLVAWTAWPRHYAGNLTAAAGEHVLGAWLKIGEDGHVTVAVPQVEHGQGVHTTLPQIAADELGADWRTIAVEPAPLNPLYANPLAADALFGDALGALPETIRTDHTTRIALMLTAGSTSVRRFEAPLRAAAAGARMLLCAAAAARWGVAVSACDTADGFVSAGNRRLRFGDLAAAAGRGTLPATLAYRTGEAKRLTGQSLPRLDSPAKLDGSASFAADIRLPDMVFASLRQEPTAEARLIAADRAAARLPGIVAVVERPGWIAAVGTTWWAANRALDALAPRFESRGSPVTTATIDHALDRAFDGPGERMASAGDLAATFRGARVVTAEYRAGVSLHAAIEPPCATAAWREHRLELWVSTQAPSVARAAVARTLGIAPERVIVHAMPVGGGFGEGLDHRVAEQAAILADRLRRPVQLTWPRTEACLHDRYRPPAAARMTARLGGNGQIAGWLARIAAPPTGRELAHRLLADDRIAQAALALAGTGDAYAVDGAVPPYRLPAYAVDHHPAEIGVPTGHLRGGAHGYTCFFTECFIDELAHVATTEAMSFRIGMLGGNPRLARCLSTAASLGGWQGGVPGSGQGLACHGFRGSYIAVLAEAHVEEDQSISVDRIVAAVDCGRVVNPDVVRQNIEGGLLFGVAAALGASTGFAAGLADARGFDDLDLPTLADSPDITVELIPSDADPGGVDELAVPPVAPAIANALQAATGYRLRELPLRVGNR